MKRIEKFKVVFSDVLRLMWFEKSKHVLNVWVVGLMLWGLGLGVLLYKTFEQKLKRQSMSSHISVVLNETLPQEDLKKIEQNLCSHECVGSCLWVGPMQAKEKFKKLYPEYAKDVEALSQNPFPQTLDIVFKSEPQFQSEVSGFLGELRAQKKYDIYPLMSESLEKGQKVLAFFFRAGVVFLLLMILAMGVVMHRFVTHFIFDYQREIEILKWVGATDRFVFFPYVVLGGLLSFMSWLMALLGLKLALVGVGLWSQKTFGFGFESMFFSMKEIFLLTFFFIVLGICASYAAIKKTMQL